MSGYSVYESVHDGREVLVMRARDEAGRRVVLKVLRDPWPSAEQLAWFREEFARTRALDVPGAVPALALVEHEGRHAIVLADGGDSLARSGLLGGPDLAGSLQVAVLAAQALAEVHARRVIHKDINPANLVIEREPLRVRLIDFGLATELPSEASEYRPAHTLEGTLPYLAPEQTGRIGRPVDWRADLYSLGATLYELFVGRPPFDGKDALEYVHAHVARFPAAPDQLRPDLPATLSRIILKLLAKNPEDRYQSARGLHRDLSRCLHQWQEIGAIANFEPSADDRGERFAVPGRPYGRDGDRAALLAAFERASRGPAEAFFITGEPGIGKSTLVHEVHRPLTAQRGRFAAGKFEPFARNIPYSAVVRALEGLLHALLAEPEEQLARRRGHLREALGPNGRVIADVLPALELLLGPQPPVPALAPEEAFNRLALTFERFVRVFAREGEPLALFLDDLQWADAASLRLLEALLLATDAQHLLVIACWRDGEVDAAHPLRATLQALESGGARTGRVHLGPLPVDAVRQLVVDATGAREADAAPLAALLVQRTGGNPFFLGEFLRDLHRDGLLRWDDDAGGWSWDTAEIAGRRETDNIIDLLARKVGALPEETRALLGVAACVGSRFTLGVLAAAQGCDLGAVARALRPALEDRLVEPDDSAWKIAVLGGEVPEAARRAGLHFAHDRVQQAVYDGLSEAPRRALHAGLGRQMLAATAEDALDSAIFPIVDQLERGGDDSLVVGAERLAHLHLRAARRARQGAAWGPARERVLAGLRVLARVDSPDPALRRELLAQAVETAYLGRDWEAMEAHAAEYLAICPEVQDQVRVIEVRLQSLCAQKRFAEAVEVSLELLARLGVGFPREPGPEAIGAALAAAGAAQAGRRVEDLLDAPRMTDPGMQAAMRVINRVFSAAYLTQPVLALLMALKQAELSLIHGSDALTPYAYATYGFIFCGVLGDFDTGYRFGRLALALVEHLGAREIEARALVVHSTNVRHYKEHLEESIRAVKDAQRIALETGDIEYAGWATLIQCYLSFPRGRPLAQLAELMTHSAAMLVQLKQGAQLDYLRIYRQAVADLRGPAEELALRGEFLDSDVAIPQWQAEGNRNAFFHYHFAGECLACVAGDWAAALSHARAAEQDVGASVGNFLVSIHSFYSAVAHVMRAHEVGEDERPALVAGAEAGLAALRRYAAHAPANHDHRVALVEAELARLRGDGAAARDRYDDAIDGARAHGFLQDEALAAELAARFFAGRGKARQADFYLREAHHAWSRWGARAHVLALEARHPQLRPVQPRLTDSLTGSHRSAVSHSSGSARGSVLDLASALRASQAISGEIVLGRLLTRLMTILVENAGAVHGVLLLERDGSLRLEAEATLEGARLLGSAALEGQAALSEGIVRYVARTRQVVVLEDAVAAGPFVHDPWVISEQPRSLLCAPLMHKGRLLGVLWLANPLTIGAFAPERVELLQLLSSQAAISLESARVYADLADSERRYRELFDVTGDGVFMTRGGRIVEANPAMTTIYGHSRAELLAMPASDLYADPEERARIVELVQRQGGVRDYELRCRRKDGAVIDCVVTMVGQLDPDEGVAMRGHVRDVTETRRAERLLGEYNRTLEGEVARRTGELQAALDQLRAAQEQLVESRKMAALGALVAGVAHEINTPLGSALTAASLLHGESAKTRAMFVENRMKRSQLDGYLELADESSAVIVTNLHRAAELVKGFKQVAVDQSGEFRRVFDLKGYLQETLVAIGPRLHRAGHQLELRLPDGIAMDSYPGAFSQIVTNLVMNATIHGFPDQPGTIRIEATPRGERVDIVVADDGRGIAPEHVHRIFEPFFTTRRGSGGSGLGLHIVWNLVTRRLGGTIRCESAPGQGTRFILDLPLSLGPEAPR